MTEKQNCACDLEIPTHAAPGYRRALWLVVSLTWLWVSWRSCRAIFAGSQALKADALDFLGDGIITGLGLIAISWGARPRAYTALIQGVFLALMGLGVFAVTLFRIFVTQMPEAVFMGSLGTIALVVNLTCAAILVRYREGDANVRAEFGCSAETTQSGMPL